MWQRFCFWDDLDWNNVMIWINDDRREQQNMFNIYKVYSVQCIVTRFDFFIFRRWCFLWFQAREVFVCLCAPFQSREHHYHSVSFFCCDRSRLLRIRQTDYMAEQSGAHRELMNLMIRPQALGKFPLLTHSHMPTERLNYCVKAFKNILLWALNSLY